MAGLHGVVHYTRDHCKEHENTALRHERRLRFQNFLKFVHFGSRSRPLIVVFCSAGWRYNAVYLKQGTQYLV